MKIRNAALGVGLCGLLLAGCTAPAGKSAEPQAPPPAKTAAPPAPAPEKAPVAVPAPPVAAPAAPVPADGLVAHWTLDDLTVADATGRGHTGVVKGKVERVDGRIGGALQFPGGGDDHVEIPNAPDLENLQEGSYTVAAWFKPAGLPPGTEAENNANYGIVMKSGWHEGLKYTNEGKFGLDHWLKEDAWSGIGTWEKAFDPKQWHHVAGVVDRKAGQTRIYVDGALENTGDLDGSVPAREYGQTTWKIGIGSPGAEQWRWPAKGAIDDVRLYNKALTDAEVEKLFKATK
jgi:hypothetical protein